jgi:hypothetical protein
LFHDSNLCVTLAILIWTAGALHYDVGRASWMAPVVLLLWVASIAVAFVIWQPPWKPFLSVLVVFGLFLIRWSLQKPSNLRSWEPHAAGLARVAIQNGLVTIENVRDTEYQTFDDYTPPGTRLEPITCRD